MALLGNIGAFDANNESWAQYTERLQQFFIANAIENPDRMRAIFLTMVGPTTYTLLRDLLSPAAPTSKTLEQLLETLSNHFDPAPSAIKARYKFNTRVRHADESVNKYIAELRRMAKFCNYGESLDEMLRDRIVCGIQDIAIQRKLLAETSLTLARAIEIAVSVEAAAQDTVDLRTVTTPSVPKIQAKRTTGITQKSRKPEKLDVTVSLNKAVPKHELTIEEIKTKLRELLKNKENKEIFDWIDTHVSSSSDVKFIRALAHEVHKNALIGVGAQCQLDMTTLRKRIPLLKRYIDNNENLGLQTLYEIQQLMNELNQPKGVLRLMFDLLYDDDVISEVTFKNWERSKDPKELEGKSVALFSVRGFFTWLRETDSGEDANNEDY